MSRTLQCWIFGLIIGRLCRYWEVNILVGLLVVVLYCMLVSIEDHRIRLEEGMAKEEA